MKEIAMIIEKFDEDIHVIDKSDTNQFTQLNQKIKRTQDCLNELRQEIKLNSFTSQKKEIKFFKNQKPYIKGRLKFYANLNSYLLEKPIGCRSEIRKYINLQLSKIANENCKYNDFINYIKLEESSMDHLYFLTGVNQFELFIDNTNLYEDPDFCTLRDNLAAEIVANDLLSQFYTNELETCKKKNSKQNIKEIQKSQYSKIPWTGTKTELIELLSSLNATGSIGNGNLTLKQLLEISIKTFDIDPGNIYKIFEQIKARKSNQTKFLDKLSKSLINEIKLQLSKL